MYGSHKGGMDDKKIRKYADAYADYVKTFNIQHYFELDLDSLIGETETLHLRDRLENRVGWQTIPVWHINRGKDGWLRDLDHLYIAIGGFANCHGKGRKILAPILPWMVREAHARQTWVHALGYTDMRMLETNTYNFDSVDSTAWIFWQHERHNRHVQRLHPCQTQGTKGQTTGDQQSRRAKLPRMATIFTDAG